ncbi:MAG: hypothetical protein BGO16_12185 [Nitrobacter sp. 62-23]|nr:MAG: hypothetical protein BGO16_12185 [Nitrobacter sp. 62-23]
MLPPFYCFSTATYPHHERLANFRWTVIELRAVPAACITWETNSAHDFEMLHGRSRGSAGFRRPVLLQPRLPPGPR